MALKVPEGIFSLRFGTMGIDIFMSHDMDADAEGRDNHKRVDTIKNQLKKVGYNCWLNTSQKCGADYVKKITKIGDSAKLIIIFITSSYRDKVNDKEAEEDTCCCRSEFVYAMNQANKSRDNVLLVIMETAISSRWKWGGELQSNLWNHSNITMTKDFSDEEYLSKKMEILVNEIRCKLGEVSETTKPDESRNPSAAISTFLSTGVDKVQKKMKRLSAALDNVPSPLEDEVNQEENNNKDPKDPKKDTPDVARRESEMFTEIESTANMFCTHHPTVIAGEDNCQKDEARKKRLTRSLSTRPFDLFLTHNWGPRDVNHERVKVINEELNSRNFTTWFDTERMTGRVMKQMADGIDNSTIILVFVTEIYQDKVNGDNTNDNCQKEFLYAEQKKTSNLMIPVIMEKSMLNQKKWKKDFAMVLGPKMFVDMSGNVNDKTYMMGQMDLLAEQILRTLEEEEKRKKANSKWRI